MEKSPLISLITVVKNGAATIEKALASVRTQTFRDFEYIVLDGISTDGTPALVRNYSDCVTFFRSAPDKGANDAFNQALGLTRGSIIGILSADDWLENGAFETIARLYREKPEAGIFSFGLQEYEADAGGNFSPKRYFCDPDTPHFTLQDAMYCQGLGRFYSANLVRRAGMFEIDRYPKLCDREWYMRLGQMEPMKARDPKPLYAFRCHPGSVSASADNAATLTSLEQMRDIALDYLAHPELTPVQYTDLKSWYCFVMVRLLAYRLRTNDHVSFLAGTAEAIVTQPIGMLRRLINYRMPQAYRPMTPP